MGESINIWDRLKVAAKLVSGGYRSKSYNDQQINVNGKYYSITNIDGISYEFGESGVREALTEGYTNPYFFIVVNDLANRMARMPHYLYNDNMDVVENPLLNKLFEKPNSSENWRQFGYRLFSNALIGDVYIVSPQIQLEGISLPFGQLICPITYNVTPNFTGTGREIISYSVTWKGIMYTLPKEQVLHIKTPNIFFDDNQESGFGAMRGASKFWETSTNQLRTQAGAMKNVGANKLLTSDGSIPMLPDELEQVQKHLDSLVLGSDKNGRSNVGRAKVVSTSMKAIDIGYRPKDYEFVELNELAREQACMTFGVAPQLYGSTRTSSYNNISEMREERALMLVSFANSIWEDVSDWLIENGNIGINEGEQIRVDKSSIPELIAPNLDFMDQSKDILKAYNSLELTKAQAYRMLIQLDYTEDEVEEMLNTI